MRNRDHGSCEKRIWQDVETCINPLSLLTRGARRGAFLLSKNIKKVLAIMHLRVYNIIEVKNRRKEK